MWVETKLCVKVFGGLDQLTRVLNIARRGKVVYRGMEAKFEDEHAVACMELEGRAEEVEWVMKKMSALPEVLSVEPRPRRVEFEDPLTEVVLP